MSFDYAAALNERIAGTMSALIGMRVSEAEPGRVAGAFEARPELHHPFGMLHGGAMMTFLDSLAGLGTAISLPPGKIFTTAEFKVNFLRGIRAGTVAGEARAIHMGGRTQVWQVTAADSQGRQLALATLTQMLLEPQAPGETR